MSTDATDWSTTDLRAAEARLAEAQAEVTRLRTKLQALG
jgi:hypothetical protein